MAKSSKAVVPENVLRDVFITGLREIKRAGIEVRVGNTGTALVVAIEAWRLCSVCGRVVPITDMATPTMCQECACADVPVLAQGEASEVPA
jgi:hypothetical protein